MKHVQASVFMMFFMTLASAVAGTGRAETVFLHPFSSKKERSFNFAGKESLNFESDRRMPLSLRSKTDMILESKGLNPRIKAVEQGFKGFNLSQSQLIQSLDYKFSIDGIPLCQYQVKSSETLDGKLALFGKLPEISTDRDYHVSQWPLAEDVSLAVEQALLERGLSAQFKKTSSQPCLWMDDDKLQMVYVWDIEVDQLNYLVVADDSKVYKFQAKHFHATGKSKIYPHNVLDTATEEYSLREMNTTGNLENKYFVTVVDDTFTRAHSDNKDFTAIGPKTDAATFAEISLFTNANRQLEWLESMGYNSFGDIPISIYVHAEFQGDTNNALYQPGADSEAIYVGDGDGRVLQNLATDADVVGHELGHHVVYATVKDIQGESLVLHEGLADYFNFARTGNACLGESICPDTAYGNRICFVPNKCLRSGDNTLTLTQADLPKEPHQRSQFISGMLWDLYIKDGIALEDVTHLVLKSIDLLVADSGYQHFIIGLMMADHALFTGTHCSLILNRAIERGLGVPLKDVTCEAVASSKSPNASTLSNEQGFEPTQATTTTTTTSKRGQKSLCGVLSVEAGAGQGLPFLLVWGIPLFACIWRKIKLK